MSKTVRKWSDKQSVFRLSKRNWMAIKMYQEIEPVKVPGDRFKSLKGLYIMDRGERL